MDFKLGPVPLCLQVADFSASLSPSREMSLPRHIGKMAFFPHLHQPNPPFCWARNWPTELIHHHWKKKPIPLDQSQPPMSQGQFLKLEFWKKDTYLPSTCLPSTHHNFSRLLTYLFVFISQNNYKEVIISILHMRKGRFGQVS